MCYLLIGRLGNASLAKFCKWSISHEISKQSWVYVFMNFCHFKIWGNSSNFAVCTSILCLSGCRIAIRILWRFRGSLFTQWNALLSRVQAQDLRTNWISLMPYFLVGFKMHKACAGSPQRIKSSSSEFGCIFPPVNVVSL